MGIRFSVLASGSKANCTLVETGQGRFLIDCGLSAFRVEGRLAALGIAPDSIRGVIITHEHADHIFGLRVFSRRHKIPVYTTEATKTALHRVGAKGHAEEIFSADSRFEVAGATIQPFRVKHDAVEPLGYRIEHEGEVLTYATDLGVVTEEVRSAVTAAHALIIESNHDLDLLWACGYPWQLKERIASDHGHLSNTACARLLHEVCHDNLGYVVLAHLSENSNNALIAEACSRSAIGDRYRGVLLTANPYNSTPLMALGAAELSAIACN